MIKPFDAVAFFPAPADQRLRPLHQGPEFANGRVRRYPNIELSTLGELRRPPGVSLVPTELSLSRTDHASWIDNDHSPSDNATASLYGPIGPSMIGLPAERFNSGTGQPLPR